MKKISFIILAAGKSRRMKSQKSKVLHKIANRPLIDFVADVAFDNSTSGVFFVCSNQVQNYIKNKYKNAKTIIQKRQLGTAHAVECVNKIVPKKNNDVVVLFGDVPLVKKSTIKRLIKYKKTSKSKGVIVTFVANNPFGYGRVIIEKNTVKDIIEQKDASKIQQKINICNSGILICDSSYLFKSIKKISNKNFQKERFLTDICSIAYADKNPFSFISCDETEVLGINSPKQLIYLETKFQKILKNRLIENGTNLIQPETIIISYDTVIGKEVTIEANTVIKENVTIKDSARILSGSYLENCTIGNKSTVGPYARIRPKTKLEDNVKIGNFVEVKNSKIGKNSSVAHLSYIGDSIIGKNVNIGAGTITCNFDGYKKNKTIIEDGTFVGSNCSIIAPIKIKKNSVIGAGSVIDESIPPSSLAIERSKLLIKKRKIKKNS